MPDIALDTDLVTLVTDGPVATLTLNRPDARNALSLEMIAAMEVAIERIEAGIAEGLVRSYKLALERKASPRERHAILSSLTKRVGGGVRSFLRHAQLYQLILPLVQ